MISEGIEFRRSARTDMEWAPFCSVCHLPVVRGTHDLLPVRCSDARCGWSPRVRWDWLEVLRSRLPKALEKFRVKVEAPRKGG